MAARLTRRPLAMRRGGLRARRAGWCVALACAAWLLPGSAHAWTQRGFLIGGFGLGGAPDSTRLVRLADAGLDFVINCDRWENGTARALVAQLEHLHATRPGFTMRAVLSAKADPDAGPGDFQTFLPGCGDAPRKSRLDDISENVHPDGRRVRAAIRARLAPGRGLVSPMVLGWYLHDEPVLPEAMDRAFWSDTVVAAAAPAGLPYVNLMPPYVAEVAAPCVRESWRQQFGADRLAAYRAYLESWLARFDHTSAPAPMLSADHYAYEAPGEERTDYLFTLRALRDAAAKHGRGGRPIPLWLVLQLAPHVFDGREAPTPTPAQCAYTAWAALAHGAKAVLWWSVVPLPPPFGAGLLDAHGAPSPRYDATRELDARLHQAGGVLFGCDAVAAFVADARGQQGIADEQPGSPGARPGLVRAFADDAAGHSPRSLLAGHLRTHGGGAEWLLVTNRDAGAESGGRLRLAKSVRIEQLDLASGRRTLVSRSATALDVSPPLEPGDAALYRLTVPTR